MNIVRLLLLPLFLSTITSAMQSPPPKAEKKASDILPYVQQLKEALSNNAVPEDIRKIIETIQSIRQEFVKYPLERKKASAIIAREKAFLIGTAKSAAERLDIKVKYFIAQNKPLFAATKKEHENAYINIELINNFLATLEPQ